MFKPLISFQDSNFDLTRTKLNLDVHYIPPSSKLQLVVPVILLWQGWYMYLWRDGTVLYTLVYMCIQRCMEIYLNLVRYNRNSLVFTYKDKTQFTQFVKWKFLSWYMLYIYWSSCIYEFYLCNKTFIYTALYIYFTSLLEKRRHSVPPKNVYYYV